MTRAENAELDRIAVLKDRQRHFTLFADLQESAHKDWLVRGLLGAGEASATYGAPGCGKSVLIEDLGLHIAAGREWHGREVKQGAVLYVALERKSLVIRRAIAFRKKHGDRALPFAVAGGVLDFREMRTEDGKPVSRAAEYVAFLCREVLKETGCKVVLVVIDTLSRGLAGGDENSPKDMGTIVTSTAKIQEATGAHVMWVHHVPHEAERMRGHGALLGAMDTTLFVAKFAAHRKATVIKANDSEEGEAITFDLESVEIGDDGTTAPVVVAADGNSQHQGSNEPKLSKNQRTAFSILHEAGAKGLHIDEWNERLRANDIGTKRRADLTDLRMALKSKNLIRQLGDLWTVNHD